MEPNHNCFAALATGTSSPAASLHEAPLPGAFISALDAAVMEAIVAEDYSPTQTPAPPLPATPSDAGLDYTASPHASVDSIVSHGALLLHNSSPGAVDPRRQRALLTVDTSILSQLTTRVPPSASAASPTDSEMGDPWDRADAEPARYPQTPTNSQPGLEDMRRRYSPSALSFSILTGAERQGTPPAADSRMASPSPSPDTPTPTPGQLQFQGPLSMSGSPDMPGAIAPVPRVLAASPVDFAMRGGHPRVPNADADRDPRVSPPESEDSRYGVFWEDSQTRETRATLAEARRMVTQGLRPTPEPTESDMLGRQIDAESGAEAIDLSRRSADELSFCAWAMATWSSANPSIRSSAGRSLPLRTRSMLRSRSSAPPSPRALPGRISQRVVTSPRGIGSGRRP
ncbi:hypothetical protein EDB85DRAFT_1936686 [Lactarius pseudohatsudake]|nr:hypothetical protein EDB85DRAFT_1936686 [Lactarius pseudohatsudake]